jgi:hypothetical protein
MGWAIFTGGRSGAGIVEACTERHVCCQCGGKAESIIQDYHSGIGYSIALLLLAMQQNAGRP